MHLIKTIIKNVSNVRTLNPQGPNGQLIIIPTPIGNLKDLTPNIVKKLFEVDVIGCEDRRVAGHLFKLIENRQIIKQMNQKFGNIGLNELMEIEQNEKIENEDQQYKLYQTMGQKQKRKFHKNMSLEEQKQFKLKFLKYKARRILNKHDQFAQKHHDNQYDLYGIQSSDLGAIQSQIKRTRARKGRGILIPLNTYTQTKMFDLVKVLLESRKVGIITDAGMPCISDPGWRMIDFIRNKMPKITINVLGGPSAVSTLTLFSTLSSTNNNLSGRFEGFAGLQVSKANQDRVVYDEKQIAIKKQDFSIHFINYRKLKRHALGLQKIYGQKHNILITSQLSKKFQRKYHDNLSMLNRDLKKQDNKGFEQGGQMSYLLYSIKQDKIDPQQVLQSQKISLSVDLFLEKLSKTSLKSRAKAELISNIFGIKYNDAKKKVYSSLSQSRPKINPDQMQKVMKQMQAQVRKR